MSSTSRRVLVAGSLAAVGLSGCVMVPVASDGTPIYPMTASAYPALAIPVPNLSTGAQYQVHIGG